MIRNIIPDLLTKEQKQINIEDEIKNLVWTEIEDNNFGYKYYHSQNFLLFGKLTNNKIKMLPLIDKITITDKNKDKK